MSTLPSPPVSGKPRCVVSRGPIREVLAILAKLWHCDVASLCWQTAGFRGFTMRELLTYAAATPGAHVNWRGWSAAELKARPAEHLSDGFGMAA